MLDRPSADRYLNAVREAALEALASANLNGSDPLLKDGFVYYMVLQHEYQHNETMLQTLQLMKGACYRPEAQVELPPAIRRTKRWSTYPAGASAYGALGMIGDVWEWTASEFSAYLGFESFPYPEYSEIFFDQCYMMLRGGSWATHPGAIRNTFRNWDFLARRQLFVGFRCARDA